MKNKKILLGITGGIAAYKSAILASAFTKEGAAVDVIMTPAATRFVAPLTFQTLTRRRVFVDMWNDDSDIREDHISLSDRPDIVVIAPATANTLAKIAYGLADNLLTSTILACNAPLMVAPAMNTRMWENPATRENMETLVRRGVIIVGPASGRLACETTGVGRMVEPQEIIDQVRKRLSENTCFYALEA